MRRLAIEKSSGHPEIGKNWTTQNIGPQASRLVVVTGATGRLGYETSLALAHARANAILRAAYPMRRARSTSSFAFGRSPNS